MAAVAVLMFLILLAACGWGCWVSVRLIFRSASKLFAPNFGPPAGARQAGPEMPATAVSPSTRPGVPAWADKLIGDHIAKCSTCRESYVTGTLPLLEPETLTRILALIEDHEPVTP
jgi:hypothetical protein